MLEPVRDRPSDVVQAGLVHCCLHILFQPHSIGHPSFVLRSSNASTASLLRTPSTMHSVFYILATFLSIVIFASATNDLSLPEMENAMKALITKVREEQVCPSRSRRTIRPRQSQPTPIITHQTLNLPHVNLSTSSAIKRETYEYVNSVLSAVMSKKELEEAQNDPEDLEKKPLRERHWYAGLPADVKEYLTTVGQADQRFEDMRETKREEVKKEVRRIRGTRWWWDL